MNGAKIDTVAVRTKGRHEYSGPIFINVISRKGGVGKTTAALCLAKVLLPKHPILFIDADLTGTNTAEIVTADPWKSFVHVVSETSKDQNDSSSSANLIDLFFREHIGIQKKRSFAIGTSGQKGTLTFDPNKVNILGSDLQTPDGKSCVPSPQVLLDEIHSLWMLEYLQSLTSRFTRACKTVGRNDRPVIIFDNSPGYVGLGERLEGWLLDLGPQIGKHLIVRGIDRQDVNACHRIGNQTIARLQERIDAANIFRILTSGDSSVCSEQIEAVKTHLERFLQTVGWCDERDGCGNDPEDFFTHFKYYLANLDEQLAVPQTKTFLKTISNKDVSVEDRKTLPPEGKAFNADCQQNSYELDEPHRVGFSPGIAGHGFAKVQEPWADYTVSMSDYKISADAIRGLFQADRLTAENATNLPTSGNPITFAGSNYLEQHQRWLNALKNEINATPWKKTFAIFCGFDKILGILGLETDIQSLKEYLSHKDRGLVEWKTDNFPVNVSLSWESARDEYRNRLRLDCPDCPEEFANDLASLTATVFVALESDPLELEGSPNKKVLANLLIEAFEARPKDSEMPASFDALVKQMYIATNRPATKPETSSNDSLAHFTVLMGRLLFLGRDIMTLSDLYIEYLEKAPSGQIEFGSAAARFGSQAQGAKFRLWKGHLMEFLTSMPPSFDEFVNVVNTISVEWGLLGNDEQ